MKKLKHYNNEAHTIPTTNEEMVLICSSQSQAEGGLNDLKVRVKLQ